MADVGFGGGGNTRTMNIVINIMTQNINNFNLVDNQLKKIDNTALGMNKKMLGLGLGMTFFLWGLNMQIQRLLRSMFNTFQQAEGETGVLNQGFNVIRANLAAISIAFWDAFAQSGLFEIIISWVERAANWFLNLSDSTREWLSSSLIVFAGIIRGIQIVGQTILALNTIAAMNPFVLMFGIAAIVVGAFAVYFLTKKDEIKSDWQDLKDSFETAEEFDLGVLDTFKLFMTDFAIWLSNFIPVITALIGGLWGGIIGGPPGAIIGASLGSVAGFAIVDDLKGGLMEDRNKLLGITTESMPMSKAEDIASGGPGALLDMIDKQAMDMEIITKEQTKELQTGFNESLKNTTISVANTPADPLSFMNEKDKERYTQLQKMIEDNLVFSENWNTKTDELITAVKAIEINPVIKVNARGGGGSGTPTDV